MLRVKLRFTNCLPHRQVLLEQRIELQGRVLLIGGDAGVADPVHGLILQPTFATRKSLISKVGGLVAKRTGFETVVIKAGHSLMPQKATAMNNQIQTPP